MMPSSRSAIYSIKPTLKIVPQDGIIPISPEADSAGPMAKSALDVADLLDILVDPSATKIPEGGYRSAITGSWGDLRIGVLEPRDWMSPPRIVKYEKSATDQMVC
jgi:amidase